VPPPAAYRAGEDWSWCYLDEVAFLVDGIAARPASRRHRSWR